METPIPQQAVKGFLTPSLLQQKMSLGCPVVLVYSVAQTPSCLQTPSAAAAAAPLMCEWPLQCKNVNNTGGHSCMELPSPLPSPCISHLQLLAFAATILWAILSLGQQDCRPSWSLKYILLDLHMEIFKLVSLRLSTPCVSIVETASRNYSFCCHIYYLGRCFFLKIFYMVGCPHCDYEVPSERWGKTNLKFGRHSNTPFCSLQHIRCYQKPKKPKKPNKLAKNPPQNQPNTKLRHEHARITNGQQNGFFS